MSPRPAASTTWLLVAAGVLAAVVAAALVARGGATAPDAVADASPAATVRDFLVAHRDRDVADLRATLARDLRTTCEDDELRRATRDRRDADARVVLVGTEEFDGTAEVEVRRTEHRGEPPFGAGGYERTEVFELVREGGAWRISQPPWSYPTCAEWRR